MKLLYFSRTYNLCAGLLLFASPMLMAQEAAQDSTKHYFEIGIRHNGSRIFYEHPKIGLPGGPLFPPTSQWYSGTKYQHYFDEGIGVMRQGKLLYYRIWADYYNYRSEGHGWGFSGLRISPGTGKEWKWKFMGFNVGFEVPVELKWLRVDKREIKTYDPLAGEGLIVVTEDYHNGINAIGVSSFLGVDFYFLKRFSGGVELRNGVWFNRNSVSVATKEYYNSQGELYKTDVSTLGQPGWWKKWDYLIPSLSLSYRL